MPPRLKLCIHSSSQEKQGLGSGSAKEAAGPPVLYGGLAHSVQPHGPRLPGREAPSHAGGRQLLPPAVLSPVMLPLRFRDAH